jgi:hypothetical protein
MIHYINGKLTSSGFSKYPKRGNCIKTYFKKLIEFCFAPPSIKESLFQYIIRQFLLSDSRGEPSWTLTFAMLVVTASIAAVIAQIYIGISVSYTYDANGNILSESMKGFPDTFYYLLITMFTAIAYLFRQRNKDKLNENNSEDGSVPPDQDKGLTETIIDGVKGITAKIKGK